MSLSKNSELTGLELKIELSEEPSVRRIAGADILGNVFSSLIIGVPLDYSAGLNLVGIISSRVFATPINIATGGPYGRWREKVFEFTKTDERNSWIRKKLVEIAAFNSFQIPIYATAVAIASAISEGAVDLEKVKEGVEYLAIASPIIGPVKGYFMNVSRRILGVRSAEEGAYKNRG